MVTVLVPSWLAVGEKESKKLAVAPTVGLVAPVPGVSVIPLKGSRPVLLLAMVRVTWLGLLSASTTVKLRVGAVALGAGFLAYAIRLYIEYSDDLAKRTFRYSIVYLSALFAALLLDHYIR